MFRTLVVATAMLAISTAEAQRRLTPSLDATLGRSYGHTPGEYKEDGRGAAADLLLAFGFGNVNRGSITAGVNASVYGTGATTDECRPTSTGGCIPRFPDFQQLGVLVGWEHSRSMLRGMLGPAYVSGDWREWRLAWQGRMDGAVPLARHVAIAASIRGTVIPSYRGDSFRLFALGVGLRVH